MEARAGNSILDFETLFSDFQELLNGSVLTAPPILSKPGWLNGSKGREFKNGFRNSVFWFPGIIKWKQPNKTPVAGSIFRPLSLNSKIRKWSEFIDGHIPRFCSIFQVIQVISLAKFFLAEEVDLRFNSVIKTPRTLPASLALHLVDV